MLYPRLSAAVEPQIHQKLSKQNHSHDETFEAEGQMNLSYADLENAADPVNEAEHLRAIWKQLGVGKSG